MPELWQHRGMAGAAGREWVFRLSLVAALVAAVVLVVEGPPGSGYGWGSVAVSCVLVAVPLVAVGLLVRTGDRRYAWPTLVVATVVAFFAVAALLGNWSGQSSTNHALDLASTVFVLATALGAVLAEVPLLRQHAD
jgi:asparagine N-glycosylation enzyme membrane subunit Stt3